MSDTYIREPFILISDPIINGLSEKCTEAMQAEGWDHRSFTLDELRELESTRICGELAVCIEDKFQLLRNTASLDAAKQKLFSVPPIGILSGSVLIEKMTSDNSTLEDGIVIKPSTLITGYYLSVVQGYYYYETINENGDTEVHSQQGPQLEFIANYNEMQSDSLYLPAGRYRTGTPIDLTSIMLTHPPYMLN